MKLSWAQGRLGSVFWAVSMLFFGTPALAVDFPIDDAFGTQYEPPAPAMRQPGHDSPGPVHRSLDTLKSSEINEPLPIPDFMRRFNRDGDNSWYFYQLQDAPRHKQVRSRVYNIQGFKQARNICLVEFDNKTSGPFKDGEAARVVTQQISKELRASGPFRVTVTRQDVHLKLISKGAGNNNAEQLPQDQEKKNAQSGTDEAKKMTGTPCGPDGFDAVMVGAVTKFVNQYHDRHGKARESLSPGVEFGVYLVKNSGNNNFDPSNIDPGDVLWAAHFAGRQETGLSALLNGNPFRWISKKDLSEKAMKNVLKDFKGLSSKQ